MKIKILLSIFYIIFIFNSNLLSDENNKTLKVGLLAPLSGPYSEIGNSLLFSLQLALEEINDKKVTIVPRDSGFNDDNTLSTAINHYNESSKEFKKIDKDVIKISSGNSKIGLQLDVLDKPTMD